MRLMRPSMAMIAALLLAGCGGPSNHSSPTAHEGSPLQVANPVSLTLNLSRPETAVLELDVDASLASTSNFVVNSVTSVDYTYGWTGGDKSHNNFLGLYRIENNTLTYDYSINQPAGFQLTGTGGIQVNPGQAGVRILLVVASDSPAESAFTLTLGQDPRTSVDPIQLGFVSLARAPRLSAFDYVKEKVARNASVNVSDTMQSHSGIHAGGALRVDIPALGEDSLVRCDFTFFGKGSAEWKIGVVFEGQEKTLSGRYPAASGAYASGRFSNLSIALEVDPLASTQEMVNLECAGLPLPFHMLGVTAPRIFDSTSLNPQITRGTSGDRPGSEPGWILSSPT